MLKVGDKYEYEFSYTQQDVELFARVTGDNNPIHIDNARLLVGGCILEGVRYALPWARHDIYVARDEVSCADVCRYQIQGYLRGYGS